MKICIGCGYEFITGRANTKICEDCKCPDKKFLCRYVCEQCNELKCEPRAKKPRFCNGTCKNKWEHANGVRVIGFDLTKTNYQKWLERFGKEIADKKQLAANEAVGRAIRASDMTHMKEVNRKKRAELNRLNKGKTIEEIYGVEKAKSIRQKLSENFSGEKNPAYGKVYANGGKSVKGYYKGLFFRSLFEYSFMKYLETKGISLHNDVKYETFRFKYVWEGRNRTYCSDFFVISENTLYEVKPAYALNNALNQCKFDAARQELEPQGIIFKVMTEKEFTKISFDEAFLDEDVVWKEETFAYFQ